MQIKIFKHRLPKRELLILLLALLAFLASTTAKAQLITVPRYVVAPSAATNHATTAIVLDCSAQQNMVVKWTLQLGGAGTEVMGLRFIPSIDNTLPSTPTLAGGFVLAIAANGATAVTVQTNFNVQGYRYLIGYYTTNANATFNLTNDIVAFVKRNAP